MNKKTIQLFKPLVILFLVVTIMCLIFSKQFDNINIDHTVLLIANFILFILVIITSALHLKALRNNNPYAFVRSITLSSFIKLIVIAAAVLIYFTKAGKNPSVYAIGAAMILYILYTILEVKGAMRLNRKKNAQG